MVATIATEECCYLSTPEHLRSFLGRVLYIYTAKGNLCLTPESLSFISTKGWFLRIPLNSIEAISSKYYPRLVKPIPLYYIEVRYRQADKASQTVLLTPTRSWVTPVWKTNQIVTGWASLLAATVHRKTASVP